MEISDENDSPEINEVPFLPKDQSDILLLISFLIGFTAIYAFNKKIYDCIKTYLKNKSKYK